MLSVAGAATAQTRMSATIGYQALHLPDTWAPLGVNVDVASHRTDAWSVLGEFGLAHESGEDDAGGFNIYNLGGGARWSGAGDRITPFAQVLAGIQISTSDTDSDTAFMIQPGAGIHVPVSDRAGITAQVDYRPVFYEEETVNEFRFVVGARFSIR
jgi:hypothetical protein